MFSSYGCINILDRSTPFASSSFDIRKAPFFPLAPKIKQTFIPVFFFYMKFTVRSSNRVIYVAGEANKLFKRFKYFYLYTPNIYHINKLIAP